MVELQIISKILSTGDYSIIEDNLLTEEYFKDTGYEEEFAFITNHYKQYGNVPDEATFLSKFKDIELVNVTESDKYLVDTIREEYLFKKAAPIIQKIADMANTDANAACEYMLKAVKELTPNYQLGGTDLIANAEERLEHYKDRAENQSEWYFASGFPEIDKITNGIQRGEEFILIFGRTNNGKSWILEKMITHIWKQGFNVGYISPEMGADSIGYRFDTLFKGFSNTALIWGKKDFDVDGYSEYIKELKKYPNKFLVSTPADFDRKLTVSKLRNWIKQNNLEAIAIDGISYMTDERGKRNDNKTTTLTNISEDLMALSVELGIPVLAVHQANRGAVIDKDAEGTPGVETIRDSDGISHNCTQIFSVRQKDDGIEIGLEKQRNGKVGNRFRYVVAYDTGEYIYTESEENISSEERTERRAKKKASGKDVF